MAYVLTTSTAGSEQQLFSGPVHVWGFWLVCDGSNDPVLTMTDKSATATGSILLNGCTFDASALGLNGALWAKPILCKYGIAADVTCAGTFELTVLYE